MKILLHVRHLLMFEHICVKAAFDLAAPRPASCAFVIVNADRNCAGGTANTSVALFKQRMRRQVMFFHITLHIVLRPIYQRIDLYEPIFLQLQDSCFGSYRGLVTTNTA